MQKKNIPIINHSNINPQRHLNQSRLRFNFYNLSVSNLQRNRDSLSSTTSSFFLNDTSCLSFSNLLEKSAANDLPNIENPLLRDPNTLVIIGHLNIKSFRNKYEMFAAFIENFNIFLISESKLDNAFPDKEF